MDKYTWEYLDSTEALRAAGAEWDALWQRSAATLPTSRAELVCLWIEHFAPRAIVRAITVRNRGRIVAALPLYGVRRAGMRIGYLPGNAWSTAGELLLDPAADNAAACDQIVAGLRALRWPIIVLGGVPTDGVTWRALAAALQRQGMPVLARQRFRVEQARVSSDWPTYFAGRSRSVRRQIRRSWSKAENAGTTRLRVLDQLSSAEIAVWLRRGFEMENRGWKGAADSSVLKTRGAEDFYLAQARRLAEWEQLRVVVLEHKGQPVAFEYGWASKGVYFSPKVAYDEAFAHFSPGQLLRAALLERFHAEPLWRLVDYLGPSSRATAEWSTSSYPVSRVIIAAQPLGRMALGAYQVLRPLVRTVRGRLHHGNSTAEAQDAERERNAESESSKPLKI